MKQSARKRVSLTKLTLARIKYIREHYFQFAAYSIRKRRDLLNVDCLHRDTMIIEASVEAFFNAMCKVLEVSPEETDKLAVAEYANKQSISDEYLEKLSGFVELEYDTKKKESITPEDRKKAVDEYMSRKNQDISDEWGEEQ